MTQSRASNFLFIRVTQKEDGSRTPVTFSFSQELCKMHG